jgi:hypothetical protein
MKKLVLVVSVLVMAITSCQTVKEDTKSSSEENKKISTLYHERNLEDIDKIIADDFVGSYFYNDTKPIIWNIEGHRNAITKFPGVRDSILVQIAEGDWVAERFIRSRNIEGIIMRNEVMQFKQFKNGKIIRSWELFSPIDTI